MNPFASNFLERQSEREKEFCMKSTKISHVYDSENRIEDEEKQKQQQNTENFHFQNIMRWFPMMMMAMKKKQNEQE